MDAIERFAADVAHEIKNPITSLKSAIETVVRIDDPVKQKRLLALVLEDIDRLNRLITDISNASRLDAELFRDEFAPVPARPSARGAGRGLRSAPPGAGAASS